MPLPRLQDVDATLDWVCANVLGDLILIWLAGATDPLERPAHVYYADKLRSIEGVEAVDQNIRLELRKADAPMKPGKLMRIQLPLLPDRLFMPINVGTDDSGTHWLFDLKDVPSDG